jgi:hypothetical protein
LRNTQIKKTSNDIGKKMLMGLPSAGAPAEEEQEVPVVEQPQHYVRVRAPVLQIKKHTRYRVSKQPTPIMLCVRFCIVGVPAASMLICLPPANGEDVSNKNDWHLQCRIDLTVPVATSDFRLCEAAA